jgi:DNA-binding beta-propeller fold protein YncE
MGAQGTPKKRLRRLKVGLSQLCDIWKNKFLPFWSVFDMPNTRRRVVSFFIFAASTLVPFFTTTSATAQKPFQIEQRWTIGGTGGWDYLTVEPATHRLYIAHLTRVDVIDTTTGKVIGAVGGLTRCHGIVIAPDGKTGFVSDGGANNVVVFDTSDFSTLAKIPAGTNPDGMVYEGSTNTLWAFNGSSKNATVIDAASRKAVGTVTLPGKPEFPQSDNAGTVFVNIEDKNSIVRLDAKAQKITATWPLAECDSPSGLAFDKDGGRLFSVCDGKKMAVTDSHTGKSLGTPTIGDNPDAAGYDASKKLAFSSNGDGTLSIVDASKATYAVVQTLSTMKGARTMAFDPSTGKVYTVTAEFGATPPATAATPHPRPSILPDSFIVLVIGQD